MVVSAIAMPNIIAIILHRVAQWKCSLALIMFPENKKIIPAIRTICKKEIVPKKHVNNPHTRNYWQLVIDSSSDQ